MRKIFLVVWLSVLICFAGMIAKAETNSEDSNGGVVSEAKMRELVQRFKKAVKTDDPGIIAEYVEYPYSRPYPIPEIDSPKEFVKQYDMLMDRKLRQEIVKSSMQDWEVMGWRGIMFDNGTLWLDTDGKLIAINATTPAEEEYITKWYEKDRASLYAPLRDYNANVYVFETKQWKGRIDSLDQEGNNYRLVLWLKTDKMSDKPEVVVNDGTVDFENAANSGDYRFTRGDYVYSFTENDSGANEQKAPYKLVVYRDNKEISSSEAVLVKEN